MARETGGVSFEVTKSQTIEAIYAQVEEALRNQYSIGYTPKRQVGDGKYHKIKLTTRDHHLIVGTRDGYYARRPGTTTRHTAQITKSADT